MIPLFATGFIEQGVSIWSSHDFSLCLRRQGHPIHRSECGMSKKVWSISCFNLLYERDKDFLDIQYDAAFCHMEFRLKERERERKKRQKKKYERPELNMNI